MSQKGRKSRPKAARFQEFPMHDRRLVAGGAAIALGVLAIIGLVIMAPRWSVAGLDALARQKLGRSVSVRGGTHLDFSPLSIRLQDAVLSGPQAGDDSFVTAKSAVIPVTLGELLAGRADPSTLALSEPEIALLVDERGQANWDFPGFTLGQPMRITLDQASFRYFDQRNNQSMALGHVDGVLDLREDGGAAFSGTAVDWPGKPVGSQAALQRSPSTWRSGSLQLLMQAKPASSAACSAS